MLLGAPGYSSHMPRPDVAPGHITVFSDVLCGWATVALHHLYRARRQAGLDQVVTIDHQLFLLEDVNHMAINTKIVEGEKPVVGALVEELRFKPWQRDPSEFPVTSMLANEAVQAAKEQSPRAAEELDMALRVGFWSDSRCISMLHEILDVAQGCASVDAEQLREALDEGRARGAMMRTYRRHRDDVQGSPHLFFADGHDVHNPGVAMHQVGETGAGFLVVDRHDTAVYEQLVRRAAATAVEQASPA
jgi:predicted DsbA family dithiol-disulfide isomerase